MSDTLVDLGIPSLSSLRRPSSPGFEAAQGTGTEFWVNPEDDKLQATLRRTRTKWSVYQSQCTRLIEESEKRQKLIISIAPAAAVAVVGFNGFPSWSVTFVSLLIALLGSLVLIMQWNDRPARLKEVVNKCKVATATANSLQIRALGNEMEARLCAQEIARLEHEELCIDTEINSLDEAFQTRINRALPEHAKKSETPVDSSSHDVN